MKTRTLKNIALFIALVGGFQGFAQDIHFSQIGYSPLTLNPALAGANSPLQVIANYRSQWGSVASPYNTIAASVDGRITQSGPMKTGFFAAGINFFNDNSGDVKITTNNINLHLAYHLALDRNSTIGLGIYGGWGQRSLTRGNEMWGSQYNGSTYDGTIGVNESFYASPSYSFIDAGTGIVYTYSDGEGYMTQNNQRLFNIGTAFYHVNTPDKSFMQNGSDQLHLRWNVFANAIIGIENSRNALMPGIYVNKQKSSFELLYGTYWRYTLTEGSHITGFNKPLWLSIGAFHRWNDAMIAKLMMEWSEYSFGFAYDFNLSKLSTYSNGMGGFEVFLRYNMEPSGIYRSKL